MRNRDGRRIAIVAALALVIALVTVNSSGAAVAFPGRLGFDANRDGVTIGLDENGVIRIGDVAFDPISGEPAVHASLDKKEQAQGERGLYLVQLRGPVYDSQKTAITAAGGLIGDYIPDNAFIVRMTPEVKKWVKKLSFVRAIKVYKPAYKVGRGLKGRDGGIVPDLGGKGSGIFKVLPFDPEGKGKLTAEISSLGGKVLGQTDAGVVGELQLADLAALAQSDDVLAIEEAPRFQLFNDRASGVVTAAQAWSGGLTGAGQVVAVADTGIDTGVNDGSIHPDFRGQVSSIYTWGRSGDASDPNGHGTHVAGSIAGNGSASSGQIKGIAYGAKLVFQSILDSQGSLVLPYDLTRLFGQAYNAGARVHSDSWGSGQNQYDSSARDVDRFVWQNPDMTIVVAAGNSGGGSSGGTAYNTISSPGTAKNAVTVGASENNRPEKGSMGDNPDSIASFSSRGNTADGRTKPDVVAPGTWVLSTRSSRAASSSNFWATYNQYYAYMGGTSMSTPITAGTAALVREYYQKQGVNARASLVKATLINGAKDLGYGFPSRDQGWGRVDVTNAVLPANPKKANYDNESVALSTGQLKEYAVDIASSGVPLKVTLAWSDYPASTSAAKALVNDLDLVVISPSGAEYHGNDFAAPYNNTFDRKDNVENVFINAPEVGTYRIRVQAYNVPQGPQRYGLVYSGDFRASTPPSNPSTEPPTTPPVNPPVTPPPSNPPVTPPPADTVPPKVDVAAPASGSTVSGTVNIQANAVDNVAVGKVDLYVDGAYKGTDTATPYTFAWDTTSVQNGSHQIYARAYDTSGNAGASGIVTVTVNNRPSQPPVNPPTPPTNPPVNPPPSNPPVTLPPADTVPPKVDITSPANGSTVSGTINVQVNAADNVAVGKVDFYIDGAYKGTDTATPYTFAWDTTSVQNGSHQIYARAYDTSGNAGASGIVTVTVNNRPSKPPTLPTNPPVTPPPADTVPPKVDISSPANGNTVSGTVNVQANAADNVAVGKVDFYVDGVYQGPDTAAPYAFAWDTTSASNGSHQIYARAYDTSGNAGASGILTVIVSN